MISCLLLTHVLNWTGVDAAIVGGAKNENGDLNKLEKRI